MDAVMAMGIGDKMVWAGFWLTLASGLLALIGLVIGFVGSQLSGQGVWDTITATRKLAEQASVRHLDQWTEPVPVSLDYFPPTATTIQMAYFMRTEDTRTPLNMRLSTQADGYGLQAFASGESGQVSMMLDCWQLFVSVSHPGINWELKAMGHSDSI